MLCQMSMKISVVLGQGPQENLHLAIKGVVTYPGKVGVPALPDKVKCLDYFYSGPSVGICVLVGSLN